jgi:hypothetical protein
MTKDFQNLVLMCAASTYAVNVKKSIFFFFFFFFY